MDTNTVQLIETFGNKLDAFIQALATKAGVASDHFYPVFVNQQRIEGSISIVLLLVASMLAFFLIRMAVNNIKSSYDDNVAVATTAFGKCVVGFFLGGLISIIIIICSEGMPLTISKIINPEYYAIHSLVQMVK